jgi:glycosyltransferase involved in cell wall biosynthesis
MLDRHLQLGYFESVEVKTVIYNARSLEGLRVPGAEQKRDASTPRVGANEFRFGFIGTISAHKGIELLLESFVELKITNAQLIIAGDGQTEYVTHLREKFRSPNIQFVGRCEPAEFFSQVDVSVAPSLWRDNLPGVVFESFAFGVPVIGSNLGGIVEMIEEGKNGTLFNPAVTGDLTRAMREMMENWKLDERCRAAVRSSGDRFFDVSRMAHEYQALYRQLIAVRTSEVTR